jgi:5-methyltetrahydropteroyltriglutamate--homocysteine methyltransferase
MKRSENRILTTHVGSIPRPAAMLEMSNLQKGPPADKEAYTRLLRQSVAEVVRKQAEVGLDIVNDGEFGKASWANYIISSAKSSGWAATASGSPSSWPRTSLAPSTAPPPKLASARSATSIRRASPSPSTPSTTP